MSIRARALTALLVVVLLGPGCAVCSIPANNFARFQCRAKQVEAKQRLKAIRVAELEHYEAHGRYTDDLDALALPPAPEDAPRYEFTVVVDGARFVATAKSNGTDPELALDTWSIDERATLENTLQGCPR